jgi:hypothetical protein
MRRWVTGWVGPRFILARKEPPFVPIFLTESSTLAFNTLKFNPGHNPMQFGGLEFVKLNECGAVTLDQRKYFPDNVPGRNVSQAVINGFFVDTGMFRQPLNRNDLHVAGIYFVYPQPASQFLFMVSAIFSVPFG